MKKNEAANWALTFSALALIEQHTGVPVVAQVVLVVTGISHTLLALALWADERRNP